MSTYSDLKRVYMLTFDSFATDPSEVAATLDINTRYARELLGTLVAGQLLTIEDVNGAETVWQCFETYDNITREEAEAKFEAWTKSNNLEIDMPTPKKSTGSATRPKPNTQEGYHPCNCGCGENVPPKSYYRPGHDARHAGVVGKTAATLRANSKERKALYAALPTDALKVKAERIEAGILAKQKGAK